MATSSLSSYPTREGSRRRSINPGIRINKQTRRELVDLPFMPSKVATCARTGEFAFLQKPYGGQMRQVCIYSSAGQYLKTFDIGEQRTKRDLCFSLDGKHIIVIDSSMNQLVLYTRDGMNAGLKALVIKYNVSIQYISVDSKGRFIITALTNKRKNGCVMVFEEDKNGTLHEVLVFGQNHIVAPNDRAIFHEDNFYVFDKNELKIFDQRGRFTRAISPGECGLSNFTSVMVNPFNEMAVVRDQENQAIKVFNSTDFRLVAHISTYPRLPLMAELLVDCEHNTEAIMIIYEKAFERVTFNKTWK